VKVGEALSDNALNLVHGGGEWQDSFVADIAAALGVPASNVFVKSVTVFSSNHYLVNVAVI
jgi:hypothetical protein